MEKNFNGLISLYLDECNKKIDRQSVIVLGVARGGTSLISGVLHHLGIPMGVDSRPPIFEDGPLTRSFRSGRTNNIKQIVDNYSSSWTIWGYKQPSIQKSLLKKLKLFPDPHLILVIKDPASIALRKENLYNYDPIETMRKAIADYDFLIRAVKRHKRPTLIISYEACLKQPLEFIDTIVKFLKIEDSNIEKALDFVENGKKNYQLFFENQLRRKRYQIEGHLDVVNTEVITGWAHHLEDQYPVYVYIEIDGDFIGQVKASQYREDLKNSKIKSDGMAGFTFEIPNGMKLKNGTIVRAYAGENRVELSGSPYLL